MNIDTAEIDLSHLPSALLSIPKIDLGGCKRAVIVFTDSTRHSPDQWLSEKILAALPLEDVTFLCAVGMHRPSTTAEKVAKLGAEIVAKYPVIDHDPSQVVTIGNVENIPVEINPLLVEPETCVIVLGVVEPHQYAGYSGGAKTAVIGCGGVQTIGQTHSASMLDRVGVRLGIIEGNPFQTFVRQAGQMIGIDMAVNVVMPDRVIGAMADAVDVVHDAMVSQARQIYECPVPNAPYDVVIAGAKPPKDVNLYQATRAATYIALRDKPVIRKGGTIILPASLAEGAGHGVGEQNFFALLQRFSDPQSLIDDIRNRPAQPGEQRAYMVAQVLRDYRLIFVTDSAIPQQAGLQSASSIDEALAMLDGSNLKVLHVKDAIKCLPVAQ